MGFVNQVLGPDIAPIATLAAAGAALYFGVPLMAGNLAATAAFDAGWSASATLLAGNVVQAGTSLFLLSAMGGGADQPQQGPIDQARAQGMLINSSSNVAALPVIYGTRRVGGTRVLTQVSGGSNEYLHLIIVLGEGEINAVTNIYIDDVLSTDARFSGLVTTYVHTGTDTQTYDTNLAADLPAIWGAAYPGKGVAYIYAKLKFSASAFTGFPTITADVQGLKVYDPRTTLTAFSNNPALCIRDYLTDARYGKGISTSLIDDTSFTTAANYCDALVAIPGGTQKRYTCDGVVNVDASVLDNIRSLLTSCRGALVYSGGLYKLVLDSPGTAAFTFNEDNIVGNWSIATPGRRTRFNRVTAQYFSPALNWQPDFAISDSPAYRTVDNALLLEASLDLPFTSDLYRAQQLAGLHLKQSRFGLVVSFTAFQSALRCEVGDVVAITHATPGWSAKNFRVNQITLKDDDEVEVVCTEYDATVYNLDTLTAITSTPTLSLPNPLLVPTPASLTLTSGTSELQINGDGTITSRIKAVWPVPNNIFTTSAEVQYKLSSASVWQTYTLTDPNQGAAWISPVQDAASYDVRVRFINTIGSQSAWVTQSGHTVVGKTAAPPIFDNFSVMVQPDGTRQYNFSYNVGNAPADWLGAEIRYVSGTTSTPDWATMTPLQDSRTYYTSSPIELNAPLAGVYTFACKSLDTTGNESAYKVVNITLPDRRLGNVFDEFFEKDGGWAGVKTGCHVQDLILQANDAATWTTPANWAAFTRWNTTPTSPVTYETPVRDFGTIVAGQVNATIDADGTTLLELATSTNGTTWSAWGSGSAAFSTRYLKLRLTVTATGPAPVPQVRQFDYQINAPIKSEYINDVVISSLTGAYRIGVGDIRIPLAGSYTFLKRTTVTIQDAGLGTWTATRIDQTLGAGTGPRWQFRFNGTLADPAFVDFFVEGY